MEEYGNYSVITNFGFCYFPLSCSIFRVVLLTVALPTELWKNMEIIQFITNFGFCYFPLSCSIFRVVLLTVALPTELCENILQTQLSLGLFLFRQLSTFPGSRPPSIIDVKELNFCVRHGNRWILLAIATGFLRICLSYPQN